MPITVQCGGCRKVYQVDDRFAGKRLNCNACGQAMLIPALVPAGACDRPAAPSALSQPPPLSPRALRPATAAATDRPIAARQDLFLAAGLGAAAVGMLVIIIAHHLVDHRQLGHRAASRHLQSHSAARPTDRTEVRHPAPALRPAAGPCHRARSLQRSLNNAEPPPTTPPFFCDAPRRDFGTCRTGDVLQHTFTITNRGTAPLTLTVEPAHRASLKVTVPQKPIPPRPVRRGADHHPHRNRARQQRPLALHHHQRPRASPAGVHQCT